MPFEYEWTDSELNLRLTMEVNYTISRSGEVEDISASWIGCHVVGPEGELWWWCATGVLLGRDIAFILEERFERLAAMGPVAEACLEDHRKRLEAERIWEIE